MKGYTKRQPTKAKGRIEWKDERRANARALNRYIVKMDRRARAAEGSK